MVTIPSSSKSEGSGYGLSFWLPFLGCARRAYLERQSGLTPVLPGTDDEELVQVERQFYKNGKPKLNQTKVGVLVHTMLEYYHGQKLTDVEFVYEDDDANPEYQEALRIFKLYRQKFSHDHFGEVEAVEDHFKLGAMPEFGTFGTREDSVLKTALEQGACANLLGVPVFTGRRDLRTQIVSDDQRQRWLEHGAWGIEAGDRLLIDHKTKKSHDSFLAAWATENMQMHAYMMAARALGLEFRGAIVNALICKAEPEFIPYYLPFPSEQQQTVVKQTLSHCYRNFLLWGEQMANPTRCFDYFKLCPYFLKQCDRLTVVAA